LAFGQESDPEPICPPLPSGPWASNSRTWFWTPPSGPSGPGNPGNFLRVTMCRTRLYCSGHSALADGRILLAGGDHAFAPVWHNHMLPVLSQYAANQYAPCEMAAYVQVGP
jgi:hypothetical protein